MGNVARFHSFHRLGGSTLCPTPLPILRHSSRLVTMYFLFSPLKLASTAIDFGYALPSFFDMRILYTTPSTPHRQGPRVRRHTDHVHYQSCTRPTSPTHSFRFVLHLPRSRLFSPLLRILRYPTYPVPYIPSIPSIICMLFFKLAWTQGK